MKDKDYKYIGTAATLKELRACIDAAIDVSGADARWNGFDDGNIYIHPVSGQWTVIECDVGTD